MRNKLLVNLLVTTGCRKGEILALQFKDIDMQTGEVQIYKSLQYSAEKGIFESTTKTDAERSNTLPDKGMDIIREYRAWYEHFSRNYIGWKGSQNFEDNYLFIQQDGSPMHPDTVSSILQSFGKRHKVGSINAHAFRHTYASPLIKKGVDIQTVSSLMAHADIQTTLRFYAHVMNKSGEVSKRHLNILYDELDDETKRPDYRPFLFLC